MAEATSGQAVRLGERTHLPVLNAQDLAAVVGHPHGTFGVFDHEPFSNVPRGVFRADHRRRVPLVHAHHHPVILRNPDASAPVG